MPHNAFLITGANAGLGKDVARQLALRADVDSIYLACRDEAKAAAARADLQRITGRCGCLRWHENIPTFDCSPSARETRQAPTRSETCPPCPG
jgi:NAD(P)-dependent dehydrogenase (short-subunit alcohol dehydrogenase family)